MPPSPFWAARATDDEIERMLASHDAHREALLTGVRTVDTGDGVPTGLSVFGKGAFVVLASADDTPVVAAAEYGSGRIVVFGHDGGFLKEQAADGAKLYANCVAWVRARPGKPAVPASDVRTVTWCEPGDDTAIGGTPVEDLVAFVRDGGSLLLGCCAWGWAQLAGVDTLATGFALNALLFPVGIAFTMDAASGPFEVGDSNPITCNAWIALQTPAATSGGGGGGGGAGDEPAELDLSPDCITACSDDVTAAGAVFGGAGGWWAPVGEEHTLTLALPPGITTLHGIALQCANRSATPCTVTLTIDVDGEATQVGAWPVERGDGAGDMDRIELPLEAPVDVAVPGGGSDATAIVTLGFSGIVDSYYIGINRLYFTGASGSGGDGGEEEEEEESPAIAALRAVCPPSSLAALEDAVAARGKPAAVGGGGAAVIAVHAAAGAAVAASGGAGTVATGGAAAHPVAPGRAAAATAAATSGLWFAAPVSPADAEAAFARQQGHRAALLKGVAVVDAVNATPGPLCVFGPASFPVLTTEGANPLPVVAAGEYGAGRVVVFGHSALMDSSTRTPDAVKLHANCLAWVRTRPGTTDLLPTGDVITVTTATPDADTIDGVPVADLQRRVAEGASLVVGTCAWGWGQIHQRSTLAKGFPLNDLLYPMGIAFTLDYASGPYKVGGSDPIGASLWACLHNFAESHAIAAGGKPFEHTLTIFDDAIVGASASPDKHPAANLLNGSNSRWIVSGGGTQWVDIALPPGTRAVTAVEIVFYFDTCAPKRVSLSRAGGRGGSLGEWAFARAPGAETDKPLRYTLPAPLSVSAGDAIRINFHDVRGAGYPLDVASVTIIGHTDAAGLNGAHTLGPVGMCLPPATHAAIADLIIATCGLSAPTVARPLPDKQWAGVLAAITSLAPEVIAQRGLAPFPGAAPDDAPRTSTTVTCALAEPDQNEWISTHLYASPGDVITATVVDGSHERWQLRVGCHSDDVSGKGPILRRWPVITQTEPLAATGFSSIAVAHGGPIFIAGWGGATPVTVEVAGGVPAPRASAETGFELVDGPAPWGELAAGKIIFHLTRGALLDAAASGQLAAAAAFWDAVQTAQHELSPPPAGKRANRVVPDVQTSCGLMHSGYPIMIDQRCVDSYATVKCERGILFADKTTSPDNSSILWGCTHELGHEHQRPTWTFAPAATEVTVNLFTLYTHEKVLGLSLEQALANFMTKPVAETTALVSKFTGKDDAGRPADFDKWSSDPAFALITFAQLIKRFGYDFIKCTMRAADADDAPKLTYTHATALDEAAQRALDAWVVHGSRTVGRNLTRFFQSWGWPVSVEAQALVHDLPAAG